MPYTKLEKVLIALVVITMLGSIIMALCISLILPRYWLMDGYVEKDNTTKLYHECNCPFFLNLDDEETQNVTEETTTTVATTTKAARRKRNENCSEKIRVGQEIFEFPFLTTLSIPRFTDVKEDRMLACTGSIISESYVLTGDACIREQSEWQELTVRVGSKYWFKGGIEYNVKNLVTYKINGPLILQVEVDFIFSPKIRDIKYSSAPWQVALVLGWKHFPAHKLKMKTKTFSVDVWMKYDCRNCTASKGDFCPNGCSGRPVVFNDTLFGMSCLKSDEGSDEELPRMLYLTEGIKGIDWRVDSRQVDDGRWVVVETKDAVDVCVPEVLTGEKKLGAFDASAVSHFQ